MTVDAEAGLLQIFAADVAAVPTAFADGTLATVTFGVHSLVGDTPMESAITFDTATPASLGSAQGLRVPVTVADGSVLIAPVAPAMQLYLPIVTAQ